MAKLSEYVMVAESAEILGVSQGTIRAWAEAGKIPMHKFERLAMDAVRRVEESQGCHVVDVSKDKCGWDLTSLPLGARASRPLPQPVPAGETPANQVRHIEVKGRIKGAATICVTRNEMLYAFNQGDKFVLAIVLVSEDDSVEGPYSIHRPLDREPDWGVSSINYNLGDLLSRAEVQR